MHAVIVPVLVYAFESIATLYCTVYYCVLLYWLSLQTDSRRPLLPHQSRRSLRHFRDCFSCSSETASTASPRAQAWSWSWKRQLRPTRTLLPLPTRPSCERASLAWAAGCMRWRVCSASVASEEEPAKETSTAFRWKTGQKIVSPRLGSTRRQGLPEGPRMDFCI